MLERLSISHYLSENFSENSTTELLTTSIGENVMSAENQQERLNDRWIVGFTDGEGCFHVAINKQPKMSCGWQVLPEFRIVQHQRDIAVLEQLKEYFGCGTVCKNHDERMEFRIRGSDNLNKVVAFFEKNPLRTTKQKNFVLFSEVIALMNEKKHLNSKGVQKIASIAAKMNRQKHRHAESSETIRQTLK